MSAKPFICRFRRVRLPVLASLAAASLLLSAGCGGGGSETQPVLQGESHAALLPPRNDGGNNEGPVYSKEWGHAILVIFREGTTEAERQAVYDKYKVRVITKASDYYPALTGRDACIVSVPINMEPLEVAAQMNREPLVEGASYNDILAA